MIDTELATAVDLYEEADTQLKQAQHARDKALAVIDKLLPGNNEGTTTHKLDDDTTVSITRGVNRRVTEDPSRLHNVLNVDTFFKKTYELRIGAYRNATPEELQAITDVITSKPAKPSVTIRRRVK